MINNIMNFVLSFLAAIIVEAIGLAVWESTRHPMFTFFGSRIGIVWFGFALALVFSIFMTWKFARKAPAAEKTPVSGGLTKERMQKMIQKEDYAQFYRELAEVPQEKRAELLGGNTPEETLPAHSRHPAVVKAERQFVAFDLHVPPLASPKYQSWFGGLPLVPKNFTWPSYQNKDGNLIPMAFLLQLDCSQISVEAGLGLMPEKGLLQFYCGTGRDVGHIFVVRYFEETSASFSLAPMPATLPPLTLRPWMKDLSVKASMASRLLPRWTFDLLQLEIPSDYFEQDDVDRNYWVFPTDYQLEHVDWSDQIEARPDYPLKWPSPVARPFTTFPQDWRAVLIACIRILEYIDRPLPSHGKERIAEIRSQATKWLDMARQTELHAALTQRQSDDFWAWVETNDAQLYKGSAENEAAALTISYPSGTSAALSEQAIELVRLQKTFPVFNRGQLRVSSPNRLLSAGSDVQDMSAEVATDHIMLLEVSSSELLGLHIGDGVLQFWIKPDDLKAKRFDKVKLMAGSY
jgi:hypothetical protein